MRVLVRGARIFVEVLGPKLGGRGRSFSPRPTIILLHGGQGFADHTVFHQPGVYSRLSALAQLIAVDLRGHGRSDRGDPNDWSLAGWAADVAELIDVLGLAKPLVLGESGGGWVAQQLARDYPGLLGGLILASTSPRWSIDQVQEAFRRRGGDDAARAAVRFWSTPAAEGASADWQRICRPLYAPPGGWPTETTTAEPPQVDALPDIVPDHPPRGTDFEVSLHFTLGEQLRFDFRQDLAAVELPVLVIAGTDDPICPIEGADEMAAAIPEPFRHYERVDGAGHGVGASHPEVFERAILGFVSNLS